MKKIVLMIFELVMVGCGIMFTSCSKNSINDSVDTNEEGVEMRIRNTDNGGDTISLLNVDSMYASSYSSSGWYSAYSILTMSSSNNFRVETLVEEVVNKKGFTNCKIACVGDVRGLGGIKNIPDGVWTEEVAVQPGYGYIIRHKTKDYEFQRLFCRYARIYVDEWILGVDGGILGAKIHYQDNWKIDDPTNPTNPTTDEWVDLGLPSGLLWANCNIGATTPGGAGDYYSWNDAVTMDFATEFGSGVRMPTAGEFQELKENTRTWWVKVDGVYGCMFTAANGNSLFLPAAGLRATDHSVCYFGSDGFYWSSTPIDSDESRCLVFSPGHGIDCYDFNYHFSCYSLRLVRD